MSKQGTIRLCSTLFILVNIASCGPITPDDYQSFDASGQSGQGLSGLLNEQEVAELSRNLVLPYESDGSSAASPQYQLGSTIQKLLSLIESRLNEGMKLQSLAPGRNFKVYLEDSIEPNAAADGQQRIFIFAPFLLNKHLTAQNLLPVLCHEMAHSALNHGAKSERNPVAKRLQDQASSALEAYVTTRWNEKTLQYTHDRTAYQKLQVDLGQSFTPEFVAIQQKDESEADIVGGMICARLGMDVFTYVDSTRNLAASMTGAPKALPMGKNSPSELPDGATFRISGMDLGSFLKSDLQDHPQDQDRVNQLTRFQNQISAHYDSKQNWSGDFIKDISSLLEASRPEVEEFWQADDLLKDTSTAAVSPEAPQGPPTRRPEPFPSDYPPSPSVSASSAGCSYADAGKNNGWGWNESTKTPCPPRT